MNQTASAPLLAIPRSHGINKKILTILFLVFLCVVPTFFIQALIEDRTHYQDIAVDNSELRGDSSAVATHRATLADYRAITRVTKYAILFITLTFATFFLFEVLAGARLHPINYGLVGLALAVFYLLLLSLAEQIGFTPAYILAAGAVVGLIAAYIVRPLKSVQKTGILAALLTALYVYLYILLQLDEYSLLFGSLLVFLTLATVMLTTRNINWYEV